MNDDPTNNQTDKNEPTVSLENDGVPRSQTTTKTDEQETGKIASRRKSVGCLIQALIAATITYFVFGKIRRELTQPTMGTLINITKEPPHNDMPNMEHN